MSDVATGWTTKGETDERERVRHLVVDLEAWSRATSGGTWETRVAYGLRTLWVMLDVRDQSSYPSISVVISGTDPVYATWEAFDKMVPEVRALFRGNWALWYHPTWVIRSKVVL